MSVVGPRPLTKKEMDALIKENPRYFYRLRVQAGLTGYAQVYGKKNVRTGRPAEAGFDLYSAFFSTDGHETDVAFSAGRKSAVTASGWR